MKLTKLNKDTVVKTSLIIVLPIVVTLVLFFLYRNYFFGNNFINKTILKKDLEFKYFTYDEFDSIQGKGDTGKTYFRNGKSYLTDSGKDNMNIGTIQMLDEARNIIEQGWNKENPLKRIAFNINSGYRTDIRNKEVGGVTNSAHRNKGTGSKAVDISWGSYNKEQRLAILSSMNKVGFKRVGKANSFIHVDNDSSLPLAQWVYSGYNNLV
jgi:hypothetical protein